MEMSERLLLLVKKLNLNKRQFADSINISPGNFSDWINPKKRSVPSTEAIFKISEVHKVNLNWLITGKGSIFLEQLPESANNNEDIADLKKKVAVLKKSIAKLEEECNSLQNENKELNHQLLERLQELLLSKDMLLKLKS